jgi:hypothetical protein
MGDKKSGLKVWKWLVLSPFILIVVLIGLLLVAFVSTALNRAFWDYRVDQLCEVDGGDTVYKKVFFGREEYTKNLTLSGEVIAPPEDSKLSVGHSVLSRYKTTAIRKGFTEVSRTETTIIRASDKEVLAKSISYHRGGGNIPFVASRGHRCGGDLNIGPLLSRTVFLKEKTNDN